MKIHLLVDFNKPSVFGCFISRNLCLEHQDDAARAWIQTDHIESVIEYGDVLFSGDFKDEVQLYILLDSENERVTGVFFEENVAVKVQNELNSTGNNIKLDKEIIVDGHNLFPGN